MASRAGMSGIPADFLDFLAFARSNLTGLTGEEVLEAGFEPRPTKNGQNGVRF
jgi:hypothetical protein